MDEGIDCPSCGHESDTAEFQAQGGFCPVCGDYNHEVDMARKYSSLRIAAAEFVDSQNVTDRSELAFRAARLVDEQTWAWPRTAAAQARQLFVAAVDDETARRVKDCESGACGHAEPTEDGDDAWAEAHDNPHVPRKKSHRTAATLPDFADELIFDS